MSLRHDVGQLLLVGLAGTELAAAERAWLRLIRPAGTVLFRRNIEEAAQVHALLESATDLIGDGPLFHAVDVEGGLVDRLRDLIAPMPAPALVAATHNKRLYRQHGYLIGSELRLLGFNLAFAPVLDLRTAASASVMRTRVVSDDPKSVIAYAEAFLTGLSKAGALGCGKHFPGLGSGALDSHHATPAIDRTFKQLWEEDMLPFRKLHRAFPFIMVSHATYPQAFSKPDTTALPASISPFWVDRTLRHKLGFRGLIVSDDMEMGGILHHAPMEEAAVAAIAAGTHLIEICKDQALVLTAYEAVLSEAEQSRSFRGIVEQAAATVRTHRHKLLRHFHPSPPSNAADIAAMREAVLAFTANVIAKTPQAPA
ncbi:MAG: beta-N-acetylhexosaminidase [Acidobacteriaceae bacterium]|jgi:beta-N-acetylhexosaminidase|nr:beta-N-acetylhexosaminidase [Acidobacteriaceae bacterium]